MQAWFLMQTILVSVFSIFFAFFAYKKKKHSATNLLFSIFNLAILIWIIVDYFSLYPTFIENPLIFIRLTICFAVIQVSSLFLLVHTFPQTKIQLQNKYKWLLAIITTITTLVTLSPYAFISAVPTDGIAEVEVGPGIIVFGLHVTSLLTTSVYLLIKKSKKYDGIIQKQTQIMLFGVFTTFSLITFTIFLPLAIFNFNKFVPLHPLYIFILQLAVAYAILRYRFMDIRFAIKRGTAHLVSIVIIIAMYSSLILFAQQTLVAKFQWDQTLTTIIAVLIIAFSVEPLRRNIIRIVNQILYSPIEKQREHLNEQPAQRLSFKEKEAMYAKQLQLTTAASEEIRDVVAKIIGTNLSFIEHSKVYLFMADGGTKTFTLGFGKLKKQTEISPEHPLHLYLNQFPQILITKEIPYLINEGHQYEKKRLAEVMEYLEHNNIEAVIPIGTRDRIVGIFLIGPKSDKQLFSQEDIMALEYFRGAAAPILSNLILYRSVQTMPIE